MCLQRADEYCADEIEKLWMEQELDRQPTPAWHSLQELRMHDYRAGGAEVSFVTKLLATAPHLIRVHLYPDDNVRDPAFCHYTFIACKRLSATARVLSLPELIADKL